MKELSIEQKAKHYDEAIKKAKYYYDEGKTIEFANYIASDIFPELKESEDERIRKSIIAILKNYVDDSNTFKPKMIGWLEKQGEKPNNVYDKELSEILGRVIRRYINDPDIPYSDREKVSMKVLPYVELLEKQGERMSDPRYSILDKLIEADGIYQMAMNDAMVQEAKTKAIDALSKLEIGKLLEIEKQGEQKPAWSEEELDSITAAINNLEYLKNNYVYHQMGLEPAITFLKSLKDRVQPQLKQEWSEEDEKMLKDTIRFCELCGNKVSANWLKSLKERYTWKPSSELDEASYQVGIKRVLENPESYGLTKYSWKPSDEQMRVLDLAIRCGINRGTTEETTLVSLFNDLKKLKE